jgi:hypothetical protein
MTTSLVLIEGGKRYSGRESEVWFSMWADGTGSLLGVDISVDGVVELESVWLGFRLMEPLMNILKMVPTLPAFSKARPGSQGYLRFMQTDNEEKYVPTRLDYSIIMTGPKG